MSMKLNPVNNHQALLKRVIAILLTSSFISLGAEMIFIPKGNYLPFIKVDSKAKIKPIMVESFYLDKSLVTNKEFQVFIENNPKWNKSAVVGLYADSGYLALWKGDNSNFPKYDSPVTYVSWFAANAYCKSQGKRLPNTDEWEYAAKFPPRGESAEGIKKTIMKWYSEKKEDDIPSIGRYQNRLGVFDMHGLVWEWVFDFNSSSVTGDSRADSDIERDLFCGAAAIKANDFSDYAAYMRYGYRSSLKGNNTAKYLGFRCASDNAMNDKMEKVKRK